MLKELNLIKFQKSKNLNIRKTDLKRSDNFEEEKHNLKNSVKISKIFEYIIELFDVYAEIKTDQTLKENKKNMNNIEMTLETQQESYESLIRKLESDLRNHMKVVIK